MSDVQAVPTGYHTVTPYLIVKDAAPAIEFYKQAFGAKELMRMPGPDGRISHAELQIGDSRLMLASEFPQMGARSAESIGGTPVTLFLYVEDVDALAAQATAAGATVLMPVQDMFWGDRYGKLADPFGHRWDIATHKENVAPEELPKRAAAAMGGQ